MTPNLTSSQTQNQSPSQPLIPGSEFRSPAKAFGSCLTNQLKNDKNFYLFSPDETTSNKLDETYTVSARAWAMPTEPWDLPESESGRIIELLSENTLFAVMLGHLLAGHDAMMTSYESSLFVKKFVEAIRTEPMLEDGELVGVGLGIL